MNASGGRWARGFSAGLMVTTAVVGGMAATPVFAQASEAPASTAERDFDIAGQPLTTALAQFGEQSGRQVTSDGDTVASRSTQGVHGHMTPAQALQQLLAGTGLTYAVTPDGTFALQRSSTSAGAAPSSGGAIRLGAVRIQGEGGVLPGADPYADPEAPYKADRLSSSKFTEPVLDTPRTVTVITKEALADKNATALKEVLRSTAGVTLGSGEGGNAFGDRFFIRGFDARNDVFVDGVRDPGVSIRDTFNDEQVEILRGPASSFAGRGTTGGALNIVTKQAQPTDFYQFEGEGGFSDSTKRGTADINKAISPVFDVRLNAMVQYADVAGRDYATDNRWGVAAAAAYHPTDSFKITANYSHTHLWGLPDFGVPYNQVARLPATETGVPHDTYYGILNRDFTRSTQDIGTINAEWKVNDKITLENKFRVDHSTLAYIGTTPENPAATGATAPYSSSATFFSGFAQDNAQSRNQHGTDISDQLQATIKFDTGDIRHTLVAGGEFSKEKLSLDSYVGQTSELVGTDLPPGVSTFASNGAPIINIFDPPHTIAGLTPPQVTGNPLRYKVNTNAGFLMDTANYRDMVILTAGLRYDDYSITASNNTSSRSHNDGIWSWNVGLTFKPVSNGSIYAAFATASDPVGSELDANASAYGGLAATQNTTQIFGPQKSKSYEIGTKWEIFDRHLLASAAVFQTDVSNARETAAAGLPGYTSGQIVANAAYRIKGVDVEVAGKITPDWSVMGGFVYLDTKVTKSIVPTNVGLQLANIAPTSFNLLTKYQITPWLELGGQSIYSSEVKGGSLLAANGNVTYPNPPRPTIIPQHWRFDLFAEAKINPHASVKLYAQNLFNKRYYDAMYQSAQPFILEAPGRAVYLSVALKF